MGARACDQDLIRTRLRALDLLHTQNLGRVAELVKPDALHGCLL